MFAALQVYILKFCEVTATQEQPTTRDGRWAM